MEKNLNNVKGLLFKYHKYIYRILTSLNTSQNIIKYIIEHHIYYRLHIYKMNTIRNIIEHYMYTTCDITQHRTLNIYYINITYIQKIKIKNKITKKKI